MDNNAKEGQIPQTQNPMPDTSAQLPPSPNNPLPNTNSKTSFWSKLNPFSSSRSQGGMMPSVPTDAAAPLNAVHQERQADKSGLPPTQTVDSATQNLEPVGTTAATAAPTVTPESVMNGMDGGLENINPNATVSPAGGSEGSQGAAGIGAMFTGPEAITTTQTTNLGNESGPIEEKPGTPPETVKPETTASPTNLGNESGPEEEKPGTPVQTGQPETTTTPPTNLGNESGPEEDKAPIPKFSPPPSQPISPTPTASFNSYDVVAEAANAAAQAPSAIHVEANAAAEGLGAPQEPSAPASTPTPEPVGAAASVATSAEPNPNNTENSNNGNGTPPTTV